MSIIQLGNTRYQVRVNNGSRQVLVDGEWKDIHDFIRHLEDAQDSEALSELMGVGINKINQHNR